MARSFIGFKNTDQPDALAEKFWDKVNEYIEIDETYEVQDDDTPEILEADDDEETLEIEPDGPLAGLELLLSIIELCHNKTIKGTGLTRPFDFSDYFANPLPYVLVTDTGKKFSSRRLKVFINEFMMFCKVESLSSKEMESFIKFYEARMTPKNSSSLPYFKEKIKKTWKVLNERIEMLDSIDKTLQTSEIGLIEVSDITTTDSQKIFNIINTGGSPLTAAEILSAKPAWNIPIMNPSQAVIDRKDELYKLIGTEVIGVVRWDLAATLIPRINDDGLLFSKFTDESLEKRISLGFKLLAGKFQNGIKKEDVNNLCNCESIINPLKFEEFLIRFNQMIRVINDYSFFNFVRSWKKSIMELLSDAILLNFLLLMYKDYENKNYPLANTEAKKFQKNAFILFDKMVYEYSKRAWRGSSDSIIAKNLATFDKTADLFVPVTREKWSQLLIEIFEKGEIEGIIITQKAVTPILYHYYFLSSIPGPTAFEIEADHIIPQALFEPSLLINKESLVNNLYNLELLPKKENVSKSDKRLVEITDKWMKKQILTYSGIDERDYLTFSDLGNIDQLKSQRVPLYENAFTDLRDEILNN